VSLRVIFIRLLINLYIKTPSQIFTSLLTYFSFILFSYRCSGLYFNTAESSKKKLLFHRYHFHLLCSTYKIQKNSAFFD